MSGPTWAPPMLARLHQGDLPPGSWALERKLDGQRLLALSDGDVVRLATRTGRDAGATYPDLVAALPRGRSYLLDGEAVAFLDGKDDFSLLQTRMHLREADLRRAPVHFVAFDILHLDGEGLHGRPLEERRRALMDLPLHGRCAALPYTTGDADTLLKRACEAGWEGLIAKRLDSPYRSGRSGDWLKLKCVRGQEFVVCGFTEPQGTGVGIGALLLGHHDEGRLRYAGKVGTGFTMEDRRRLRAALERMGRAASPFDEPVAQRGRWVDPKLVCRVDFTEWTPEGRLRHPRFVALRADKDPRQVVRE